jgi:FRG domain
MKIDDLSAVEIGDLTSLEQALLEINDRFDGLFPLWRGHANIDWKLQAEVFRPRLDKGAYDEQSLLLNFMALAESRYQRCPRNDDRSAWLTLARHYGLPTRLLDWSMSPLVALYFAIQNDNHDKVDGCLWALNGSGLNLQMTEGGVRALFTGTEPLMQQLIQVAFEPSPAPSEKVALAMSMREIDPRVLVQQGMCTIHGDASDLCDIDYKGKPWRRAFKVPADRKPDLRHWLRALGIHKAGLFPDLGALAEELKSRRYTPSTR